jgi:RNA polymerase sigma factor (TIGR02999 family)
MAVVPKTSPVSESSIAALLSQLGAGDREAEARLIPYVYHELRRVAAAYMRRERADHTLQPTALVHEAYAQLVDHPNVNWQSRAHFLATAAQVMRHILVDHARSRQAGKRGGVQHQVTLDEGLLTSGNAEARTVDILFIHQALERLAALDERQGRIVEFHFFGGLTFEEIAHVLGISERTVKREWSMARAWLRTELAGRA